MTGTLDAPAPFTPPDCDLRDFPFMLLDVRRLRDSRAAGLVDPEAFRACVLAWCASWHQVPAASLPDDDAALSVLLGYGRTTAAWHAVRDAGGLHGWVKCSDGRLYHPVVAERAKEAWDRKLALRERSQKGNRARWGERDEQKPTSHKDAKTVPQGRKKRPTGTESPSHKDGPTVPQGDETDATGNRTHAAEQPGMPAASHEDENAVPQGRESDPLGTEKASFRDPKGEGEGKVQEDSPCGPSLADDAPPEASPPRGKDDRGTRLPDEWQPGPEEVEFAADLGLDPKRVAARFRDYWHSKPGKDGRRTQWPKVWCNWCRRDAEDRRSVPAAPPRQPGKSYAGCL